MRRAAFAVLLPLLMHSNPASAAGQSFAADYASFCLGYTMMTEPIVEPYSNCACVAEYIARVTPPDQLEVLHRALLARHESGGFKATEAEKALIGEPIDPGPEGEFAGLDANCPDARLLFDVLEPPQPWD